MLNGPKLTTSVDGHRREGFWDKELQTEIKAQGNTALSSVLKGEILLPNSSTFQEAIISTGESDRVLF